MRKVFCWVVLLSVLPTSVALAQSRASLKDVDERLQRVERVLDQSLLEMLQQIESLKREIRGLRGELENQANELETLQKRNRDLYLDTDNRLTDIEDKLSDGVPSFSDGVPADGAATPVPDPGGGDDKSSGADGVTGNAPVFVSADRSTASGARSTRPVRAATAQEKEAYTRAYDMLASGRHAQTVEEFQRFLQLYPDGPYSDNAWYWQGEALYAQRQFDEAIRNFKTVIESFPASPKLPDARLKVGFSLYEQKRYIEARNILNAVKNDYPGRSAAVLARKRLLQMDNQGL